MAAIGYRNNRFRRAYRRGRDVYIWWRGLIPKARIFVAALGVLAVLFLTSVGYNIYHMAKSSTKSADMASAEKLPVSNKAAKADQLTVKDAIANAITPTQKALADLDQKVIVLGDGVKKAIDKADEADRKADRTLTNASLMVKAVIELDRKVSAVIPAAATLPAAATGIDAWDSLKATDRVKLFVTTCSQGQVFALDGDRYRAFYVGAERAELAEAKPKVAACDVDFFVKKGQAVLAETDDTTPQAIPAVGTDVRAPAPTPAHWTPPGPPGGVTTMPPTNLGEQPPIEQVGFRPGYGRPGYGTPRRGAPRCGGGMSWNPEMGICATPFMARRLTPYQQQTLAECPTRIEQEWVKRGSQMHLMQRCAPGRISPSRY